MRLSPLPIPQTKQDQPFYQQKKNSKIKQNQPFHQQKNSKHQAKCSPVPTGFLPKATPQTKQNEAIQ